MGQLTITTGPFSIAIFVYQRVLVCLAIKHTRFCPARDMRITPEHEISLDVYVCMGLVEF